MVGGKSWFSLREVNTNEVMSPLSNGSSKVSVVVERSE